MSSEELGNKMVTLAGEYLFTINPEAEKLCDKQRQLFYTLVARNLFSSKRGRLDTLTSTSFLCTRVKDSDVDD